MNFLPAAVGATFLGAYVGVLYVHHKLEVVTGHYPLVHPGEWAEFKKQEPDDLSKALIVMSRIVNRSTSEYTQLGRIMRKLDVPRDLNSKHQGIYTSHSIEAEGSEVLKGRVWDSQSQEAFRRYKRVFDTRVQGDLEAKRFIAEVDKTFESMHWLERKLWKYMVNDNRRVYAKGN